MAGHRKKKLSASSSCQVLGLVACYSLGYLVHLFIRHSTHLLPLGIYFKTDFINLLISILPMWLFLFSWYCCIQSIISSILSSFISSIFIFPFCACCKLAQEIHFTGCNSVAIMFSYYPCFTTVTRGLVLLVLYRCTGCVLYQG